jgi:hypothetical protein
MIDLKGIGIHSVRVVGGELENSKILNYGSNYLAQNIN